MTAKQWLNKMRNLLNKKRTCPTCGEEWHQSRKKAAARKTVSMLAIALPTLKEALEGAAEDCNKCWNKKIQPLTEALGVGSGLTKQEIEDATLENIKAAKNKKEN